MMASCLWRYPLEFARTRVAADHEFKGPRECLRRIEAQEGIRGLYRGFGISILGLMLLKANTMLLLDPLKSHLRNSGVPDSMLYFALTIISCTFSTYPLETVSRRLMMQSGRSDPVYTGTLDCISKIYQQEGLRGYFKGCLCKIIGKTSISLLIYSMWGIRLD